MVAAAKISATCLGAVLCLPAALHGQAHPTPGDPPQTGVRYLGPLTLAPTITVTNVGWDSNVFHRRTDADPEGDFTTTARPAVESWLRLGRVRAHGRSRVDFVYFQEYSSERSVDGDHEGRLDVPLARLTPYVSGRWVSARQRFGFEIDERTRRYENTVGAGVDVRAGPRTHIDVSARRSRLEFGDRRPLLDPLVSDFYDHSSTGAAIALRQHLTPLTSIAITVDRSEDRFDLIPARDSNSLAVSSGVELKPFALISGRAHVGWRRVRLVEPGSPSFQGFVASVDVAYTLLGSTRFCVQADRNLSYSAMRGQHAFLLAGVRGTVTHRLGARWDVGGRTGRHSLSYGLFALPDELTGERRAVSLGAQREIVTELGGEIGYRVGPDTRIAFEVAHYHRGSTVGLAREYERTRAGMTMSYRF